MVSWREVEAIKRDRALARRVVASVLALGEHVLSVWERKFCKKLELLLLDRGLTTEQAERLLQIRDRRQLIRVFDGFSIKSLISDCYEGRADLSERDDLWIARLKAVSPDGVSRKRLPWLLYCARQLNLLDDWLVGEF
ncbi:hypothetical protein SGCZBJ_00700 [Caulobacter zeae]|uniref:Uncharacterized protein n=1 Tax=Caulobacter zeae TaxID=2055137 RepID=A0A2N5DSE5_9CAUL|nr:hypothetical protein [Caulobacter zeae]PLR28989.1 hypothetical protein SGCZBJ_00700 [Caulobacter zeae]